MTSSRPVPQLHLEQMRAGERATVAGAEAAVAALAVDDARVLERLPPRTFAARILDALKKKPDVDDAFDDAIDAKSPLSLAPLSLWLPVPAMVVGVFLVGKFDLIQWNPVNESIRVKGEAPALLLARDDHGTIKDLARGDVLGSGDVVQVRVRAAGAPFGVVVSLDGNGHVTRHLPAAGSDAHMQTGTFALPTSFELDDAPRFERFFLVTGNAAIDVDAVEHAVAALADAKDPQRAPLDLKNGLSWTDFVVVKR